MFVCFLTCACLKSLWLDNFYSYVITPYNEYPLLLGLLLKLLNGELAWSTRREVLKVVMHQVDFFSHLWDILSFAEATVDAPHVLGIMGALDPHVHRRKGHMVKFIMQLVIQVNTSSLWVNCPRMAQHLFQHEKIITRW